MRLNTGEGFRLRIHWPSEILPCLLLLGMVLWFIHEVVWSGKVPFFRDLPTQHYPNRFILAQSFQAGEIPLWSRQISMGFPFLANPPNAVLYPPNIIFLVVSFFDALRFLLVFHYLIAATGSCFLCRQWNYPPYLALIGAALFTFGGVLVSLSNMMDYFQTAVWLPWILFCGERWFFSRSWKNFFALSLVLVTQFFAGSPEPYIMSQGLLFLDLLRIRKRLTGMTYGRLFLLLLAANVLVAGLSMAQLLPALELIQQSARSETIPYAKATVWSLNPLRLINLFFLDKEVDLNAYNGWNFFFTSEPPLMISLYMGVISLYGLALWFYGAELKERFLLLGLALLFLALAMGRYSPVYSFFFNYLPLLGFFRYPEKFLLPFYTVLLFMILSGYYHFFHSQHLSARRPLLALALIPLFVIVLYLFLRLERESLIRFISWSKEISVLNPAVLNSFPSVLIYLERQILLLLGVFLLLFLWSKGRLGNGLFQCLFVSLVFFDLASAHRAYHFFLNPNVLYGTPRILSPSTGEPYRVFYILRLSDLHPNIYAFTKKPYADTMASMFATLIPNTGVFHGFEYMQELESLRKKPYDLFLHFGNQLPADRLYYLLGALNVRYINSFGELPEGEITLVGHFPQYPSWLYQLERVVPRVYIVPKTTEERDPLKIMGRLSSREFNPMREVFVDRPLVLFSNGRFQSQTKILQYSNNRVAIQASLNGSGVLVLADSFYPGWRVFVDGEEKEILRANLFFRGVVLSPGEHTVEFRYQPRSFLIGLAISIITLSGIVFWSVVLFGFKKDRAVQEGREDPGWAIRG